MRKYSVFAVAREALRGSGRRRAARSPWRRILPIARIAALTRARALGDGFGGLAVAGVILAVALIEFLRRRAR